MNIKSTLTSPAFIHSLIVLVLGAFGFTSGAEIKERFISQPQDVTVDVHIPEQKDSHTHPTHSHKDWTAIIDAKVKKAIDGHNNAYH